MTTPIIPWPGGKSRLAPQLFTHFDFTHHTYVEAFAGAAAMLFLRPEPAKVEVINDVNGDLVNLYRVIKHHPDELLRQFRWQLSSREEFSRLLKSDPETLTDVHRAARFFYIQKLAFGGKVTGQSFGTSKVATPRFNPYRLEEDLSDAHVRLANVLIERLPWHNCLERYDSDSTFFFLDPPYWQLAGYGVKFEFDQYTLLASAMRTIKGKAMLTINDHPAMREAFDGFRHERLSTRYTVSRSADARKQVRHELVVFNW